MLTLTEAGRDELRGFRGDQSEQEFPADGERVGPYLTCVRGRELERENLAWCTWAARVVHARQVGEPVSAHASA